MYGLTEVTAPTEEPLTTAELKSWLRVTHSNDDDLIAALGVAARQQAESFTRRQFVTATYDYKIDSFPREIILPRPPLSSVTSIKYLDTAGAEQTLSTSYYRTNVEGIVGRIVEAYGYTWPSIYPTTFAVVVRFVSGYGAASAVPGALKTAIRMLTADMYEHREAQLEDRVQQNRQVQRLLWAFRVMEP